MPRVVFYPYKMSSQSCKTLQDEMQRVGHNTLRVYPDRNYKPKDDDFIINWGSSTRPIWGAPDLNAPESVAIATNKLKTFYALDREMISIPNYWLSKNIAEGHRRRFPSIILARSTLTGHSGQGITIVMPEDPLPDAPLYTEYFAKTHEYRVHVFNGQVLDVQEKRKRNNTGGRESEHVWNVATNFVFCRESITPPSCVTTEATKAVEALGLSFGAVDVGYSFFNDFVVVFEVNTAPGLTGTTLTKYVEKINEYL